MSNHDYHSQSTSNDADKDAMVICPYDPVHRIAANRFVRHILKCRKNHPTMEMETCPFNARHIVPKPDLRHHIKNCPDKRLLEIDMHHQSDPSEHELIRSSENLDFQTDEDWTKEPRENEHVKEASITSSFPTTASVTTDGKRVNARREAIKRMKAKMKEEMNRMPELVPQHKRPTAPENCFDSPPYVFVHDSLIGRDSGSNHPNFLERRDQSGGDSASDRKHRPMLAANFSLNGHNGCGDASQSDINRIAISSDSEKSFSAVGRGRRNPNHNNIFGNVTFTGLSQLGNDGILFE